MLIPHSIDSVRDMAISLLVDQVLKMTPKPIDWILHSLQQPYCACLYDCQFQIYSLVMWLLLLWISALRSSKCLFVDTILHGLLIAMIRYIIEIDLNLIGIKAHTLYWLLQWVLIQSIGLGVIFKSWSTSNKMTISLAFFKWILTNVVWKWAWINRSSFNHIYFPLEDMNFEIWVATESYCSAIFDEQYSRNARLERFYMIIYCCGHCK